MRSAIRTVANRCDTGGEYRGQRPREQREHRQGRGSDGKGAGQFTHGSPANGLPAGKEHGGEYGNQDLIPGDTLAALGAASATA